MKPEAITAVPQPRAPLDLGLLNFMYTSDTRGWGIEQACASITRDNERNKAKCQRVKMKFLLFQHSHVAVTSMSKNKSPHPLSVEAPNTQTIPSHTHKKLRPDGRFSTRAYCAKETSGGTATAVSVNREASAPKRCLGSSGGQRSTARGSGGRSGRGSSGSLA